MQIVTEEFTLRMNVTVRGDPAKRLQQMAKQLHIREGAGSLLSTTLDEVDEESQHVTDLLDRIPGAWERIERRRASRDAAVGLEAV